MQEGSQGQIERDASGEQVVESRTYHVHGWMRRTQAPDVRSTLQACMHGVDVDTHTGGWVMRCLLASTLIWLLVLVAVSLSSLCLQRVGA